MTKITTFLRRRLRWNAGMIAPLAFTVLLGAYCVLLYRDGFFTLYDLGVTYRAAFLFDRTFALVFTPTQPFYQPLVLADPNTKLFYIVVGLSLFVYNNPVTLLIDQTIVIALGGYAVYRIARFYTGGRSVPLTLQVVYFLFPATYGYLTHGGNFEVMFEGLFLLGYMSYLLNRRVAFVVLTILAATTLVWAPAILIGFYGFEMLVMSRVRRNGSLRAWIESLADTLKSSLCRSTVSRGSAVTSGSGPAGEPAALTAGVRLRKWTVQNIPLLIALGGAAGFLAFSFHSYSLSHLLLATRLASTTPTFASTAALVASANLQTDFEFVVSVFGIVLFLVFLSPYVLFPLVYLTGIIVFTPTVQGYFEYLQQYPYLFVGFLFLALVDVFHRTDIRKAARPVCALLIVSGVLAFSVYSPFSISAWQSGAVGQQLTQTDVEVELDHMYSLIPQSASVLVQNDMPQLMNRAGVYLNEFYDNQTVDYAVMNPLAFNKIAASFGGFSQYWANAFASNHSYGIFAEVQGADLFRLDYSGPPVYAIPLTDSYRQTVSYADGQTVPNRQLYDSPVWLFSPGSYAVTFNLFGAACSEVPTNVGYQVVDVDDSMVITSNSTATACDPSSGQATAGFSFSIPSFTSVRLALYLLTNSTSGSFSVRSVLAQQLV